MPYLIRRATQAQKQRDLLFRGGILALLDRYAPLSDDPNGRGDEREIRVVQTCSGPLRVWEIYTDGSYAGGWVAQRFDDPAVAVKLFGDSEVNRYSGKFNFNFIPSSASTYRDELRYFLYRYDQALKRLTEASHAQLASR